MTDVIGRGRAVADAFLRGDVSAVWAAMTPEMQAALGSTDGLAAARAELRAFGDEAEVASERALREDGYDVFERVSRWTEAPTPMRTRVVLDAGGQVAGLWVLAGSGEARASG